MKRFPLVPLVFLLCVMLAGSIWWLQRGGAQTTGQNASTLIEPQAITVRVLFGNKDAVPTNWNGSFAITNGTLLATQGWHFRSPDQWTGPTSWNAATSINPTTKKMTTNGILLTLKASSQTQIQVTTDKGNFSFTPGTLKFGAPQLLLSGAVSAERVVSDFTIPAGTTEDDFPTASADKSGTLWMAYVSYTYGQSNAPYLTNLQEEPENFDFLHPQGNGDQIRLAKLSAQGGLAEWSSVADLTPTGQDVYRPALATGLDGDVWVAWSQKSGGQWDIYARHYSNGTLSAPIQITQDASPDLHVALACDISGKVWLAWQGFSNGTSDIFISSVARSTENWSGAQKISTSAANDWDPQLACAGNGSVWAVWDSYDKGDYDVMLRRIDGVPATVINVTDTSKFEARPSIVCDSANRVWVAWEEAPPLWGKDYGTYFKNPAVGVKLYDDHTVNVCCYVNGQRKQTAGLLSNVLLTSLQSSFPRLGTDGKGRVFLTCRRQLTDVQESTFTSWHSVVTYYEGGAWSSQAIVPGSDNTLDARPAFAVGGPGGALYLVHTSDGRNQNYSQPWRNQVYVASLNGIAGTGIAAAPLLINAPVFTHVASAKTVAERNDISRLRGYRAQVGGTNYQIMRGEFHRHTEVSGDGKNDGGLIDSWRYGLDAASLDWMGNGDHDSGQTPSGDREYTWWLVQKETDALTVAGRFSPVFSYERSVGFPDGHRNVILPERGIRPLPRLRGTQANKVSPDDTKMLYKFLRANNGICASHNPAQKVGGTDWRDNDRQVEPIVEIYQGDRQSYEYEGAPRSATAADAIGGYNPVGYVWNALAKGYRLGFESSSDHFSTHISYAMAYTTTPARQGVLDALRARHCYAATDNILLDVRCANHIMGDEFSLTTLPSLRISATGTGPIARVVVVKNNKVVYTATSKINQVDFSWLDVEGCNGVSYYYVRIEQADGQLAWSSPMWIHGQ